MKRENAWLEIFKIRKNFVNPNANTSVTEIFLLFSNNIMKVLLL